mmetsp:Transcript_27265/g.40377  ORF Transcript_27265/g.40377 Transcript_27265/m.40377 type:complete len:87 (+) Transcript_27265:71-331(+)
MAPNSPDTDTNAKVSSFSTEAAYSKIMENCSTNPYNSGSNRSRYMANTSNTFRSAYCNIKEANSADISRADFYLQNQGAKIDNFTL